MKKTSRWWYARAQIKGKLRLINLRVEIKGQRPERVTQTGDGDFERSRGRAMAEHDRIIGDMKTRQDAEELTQRLIQIRTGSRLESVQLEGLIQAWENLPRRRTLSAHRRNTVENILKRFVLFMRTCYPDVHDLFEITQDMTRAFMKAEEKRGVLAATWNSTLSLLRSVFRHFQPEAEAYRKHLMLAPGKELESIHREPFKVEEVQAILHAVEDDDFMRPLIITALCTAMRKGDCCLLKWKDVDLKSGFIAVKTSKTGGRIEIPIMPILHAELSRIENTDTGYVFPQAAKLYLKNRSGLNARLKLILAKAGFVDGDLAEKIKKADKKLLPAFPLDETRQRGLDAIKTARVTKPKRVSMRRVFEAYMDGKTMPEISRDLHISKGSVSGYLNAVENMIGARVIRRSPLVVAPAVFRGSIHAMRDAGVVRKASVRGWHSFRTTWITLALSAGLPMELVRRVSGHTTTDVVLKHYFKPGREDFRKAIQAAMPKMLTAGGKTRDEQIDEILAVSTQETAWKDIQAIKSIRAS